MYIVEGVGNVGVQEIKEIVAEHISITKKKPIVFIDYLQILEPPNDKASDKQNTDKNILELKRMARDKKITIFIVSSLNRGNYRSEACMEGFKESGAIEYGCDVLIGMQFSRQGEEGFNLDEESKKMPRDIELRILKNRNGAKGGKVATAYYPAYNYFDCFDKI
jgi:replicative DNA helicase